VRDWGAEEPKSDGGPPAYGCKFADRCPVAMPQCLTAVPPLYRTDPRRAAACFRLSEWPVLPAADIGEVLAPDRMPEAPVFAPSPA
jgi:hypothetical protein